MKINIYITLRTHRGNWVYALDFPYNRTLLEICRSSGALWSARMRAWYYLKSNIKLHEIELLFKDLAILDLSAVTGKGLINAKEIPISEKLSKNQRTHLNAFYVYLKGKRFSDSTLKSYTYLVAEYLLYKPKEMPISLRSIEQHAENVLVKKNKSISTHRQYISGMKHYLNFINSDIEIDFSNLAPKQDKKLPNVLSHDEVIELIRVTKNIKHRICIALLYSSR